MIEHLDPSMQYGSTGNMDHSGEDLVTMVKTMELHGSKVIIVIVVIIVVIVF